MEKENEGEYQHVVQDVSKHENVCCKMDLNSEDCCGHKNGIWRESTKGSRVLNYINKCNICLITCCLLFISFCLLFIMIILFALTDFHINVSEIK